MGLLLRQAGEQGLKVKMMGPEGVGNPEVNAIAGPAVEGMLLTLPADFSTNPKNAAIVKAFKDKKRDPSGAFQLTAVRRGTGSFTASRPWATTHEGGRPHAQDQLRDVLGSDLAGTRRAT
jgi:hypothetical protein